MSLGVVSVSTRIGDGSKDAPLFSIVSAVYNVARFLPDFMDSLESQTLAVEAFEVIAVDDGSTDDSRQVLLTWAAKAPVRVTVLSQANAGQGAARNLGITHASGTWITFVDPDDVIAPDYLELVDAHLRLWPQADMVATQRRIFAEDTSAHTSHPLKRPFRDGNKMVDLDRQPDHFHGHAPSSFVRRSVLQELGLHFDERIRPNFEDGHFVTRYLLGLDSYNVAFLADAHYYYRKRADGTSTLQNSLLNPGRFTAVLRYGYLDVLERSVRSDGYAAPWVQNFLLYELSWYFSSEDNPFNSATACIGDVAAEFHELMADIVSFLDPVVVGSFDIRQNTDIWTDILLHSWAEDSWTSPHIILGDFDAASEMIMLTYRYVGRTPDELILDDGEEISPIHSKHRAIRYFDRTVMHERIAWIRPRGTVEIRLDGAATPLRFQEPPRPRVRLRADQITGRLNQRMANHPGRGLMSRPVPRVVAGRRRTVAQRMASSPPFRRRYAEAWVLIDRVHDADDSAEILFHYLREHRPDINAWFVVEQGTPDWNRLQSGSHGDRVVAHGSRAWMMLMANCSFLISSHADAPILRPKDVVDQFLPTWQFVFLQHGVIKDDLATWLNSKPIDLFVTSTQDEWASIAGDDTSYRYTTREAKLTELPRLDSLLEMSQASATRPDLLLIAPTWRQWLVAADSGTQRRKLNQDFETTDFAKNWLELLRSERLADIARAHNLTLALLPHPNMQAVLDHVQLPDHIQPLRFENVRQHFLRTALMVTDYSSMAFNVAYLGRPVVYFHFDADLMFGGGHVGRGGYFKYERDGFGPVTSTVNTTLDAVAEMAASAPQPPPEYRIRIERTFPYRDGHACARVVAAIEQLRGSGSPAAPVTPPRPSTWQVSG